MSCFTDLSCFTGAALLVHAVTLHAVTRCDSSCRDVARYPAELASPTVEGGICICYMYMCMHMYMYMHMHMCMYMYMSVSRSATHLNLHSIMFSHLVVIPAIEGGCGLSQHDTSKREGHACAHHTIITSASCSRQNAHGRNKGALAGKQRAQATGQDAA